MKDQHDKKTKEMKKEIKDLKDAQEKKLIEMEQQKRKALENLQSKYDTKIQFNNDKCKNDV